MESYRSQRKTKCSVIGRRGDADGIAEDVVNLDIFWSTRQLVGFVTQAHSTTDHRKCTYGKLPAGYSPYEGTPDRGQ